MRLIHPRMLVLRCLFSICAAYLALGASAREAADTMYVEGRHLYTAAGEKVVLRGVNEMFIWSDDVRGEIIYPEIAKSGANVVRIVWTREGDIKDLQANIENCLAHGMIPMVELHDATGDLSKVPELVDFWISQDMLDTIEKYQKWFVLNIANEAGDGDVTPDQVLDTYRPAIARIRAAGVSTPLVIDASDWGKDEEVILRTWRQLRAADPLQSVLFSVHTYWVKNQQERLDALLDAVVEDEIPFLFGEGPQQVGYDCESEFPWRDLIAQCQEKEVGWIAWSWGFMDNGDCHPGKFDMTKDGTFGNWENEWGRGLVVSDPNSIANTSVRPESLREQANR